MCISANMAGAADPSGSCSLSLSLSACLSVSVSHSVSLSLTLYLSVSVSLSLSLYLSLSLCVSLHLSLSLYLCVSLCISGSPSLSLCLLPSPVSRSASLPLPPHPLSSQTTTDDVTWIPGSQLVVSEESTCFRCFRITPSFSWEHIWGLPLPLEQSTQTLTRPARCPRICNPWSPETSLLLENKSLSVQQPC